MSPPLDRRLLVLHGLRLKGFAAPAAVAEAAGLPVGESTELLEGLVAEGLAKHRSGKVSGFALTPAGRQEHAEQLRAELEVAGARPAVDRAYARFLAHNADLLGVCTDWQLRDIDGHSSVNDHSDGVYDAQVVARLAALHAEAEPICEALGAALQRFAAYGSRLGYALHQVQAGEVDWFTKPMIASYHTVWFELHEDLLCTLGIERGSEVVA